MNKDLIKKISKEFAEQHIHKEPDLRDEDRNEMVNTVSDFAEDIIKYINEHYYIVDKDKVNNEIHHLTHGVFCDDMQTTKYIQGRKDIITEFFAISILN